MRRALLTWIFQHRKLILAGAAVVTVGYGIVLVIVPWRFCHDAGYVVASTVVLTLLTIDAAVWRVRRRP
jgi:hypothetical protein